MTFLRYKRKPLHEHHKEENPESKPATELPSPHKSPLIGTDSPYVPPPPESPLQHGQALKLWQQGESLFQNGHYEQAIPLLQQCIEMQHELQDHYLCLGCCEDRIGFHYNQIQEWLNLKKYEYCSRASPYDILSLILSQSEIRSQVQFYDKAKLWYSKMLKFSPNNYKLVMSLAHLQYNDKKFVEAEKLYKRVIDLNSTIEQAYVKISFIYCFKLYRDTEATEWAQKSLAINPHNYYAKLVIALCHKDIEQRIKLFQKLIETKPNYARCYNGLGNAYLNIKKYDNAVESYMKSIEVNEKYEHPYYGLGSIYSQLGNYDESIKWYKKCIEVSPNYDYPYYGLGIAYNNKNDVGNAIFWLQECIRINPSYDCPYYALGNIYKYSKQYHKSIEYYESSLRFKQIDPLCYANLGQSLLSIQEYERGQQYIEKALKYMNEDKSLSQGNIQYIWEIVQRYLNEQKRHQKSIMGYITLKQKIFVSKNEQRFKREFRAIYQTSGQPKPSNV